MNAEITGTSTAIVVRRNAMTPRIAAPITTPAARATFAHPPNSCPRDWICAHSSRPESISGFQSIDRIAANADAAKTWMACHTAFTPARTCSTFVYSQ